MARQKEYNETEVIDKALTYFWHNGYKATSVRMLEKAMGINQFSIYSSFKNKHGVYVECFKRYKQLIQPIIDRFAASSEGKVAIQKYLCELAKFMREDNARRGCFFVNTIVEFGEEMDVTLQSLSMRYEDELKAICAKQLQVGGEVDSAVIAQKTNYFISLTLGLGVSCKLLNDHQIEDFIKVSCLNL